MECCCRCGMRAWVYRTERPNGFSGRSAERPTRRSDSYRASAWACTSPARLRRAMAVGCGPRVRARGKARRFRYGFRRRMARQKSEIPEAKQRRVLVVEDEPMLRRTLADTLTDEGFAVRQAADGREALELLESWRPHVILLDLLMPIMDGRAFLGELRQRDGVSDILVVVISATPDKR